ncbi:hypothetical protein H0H87_011180, partial [Tephrocybe sp. NHM501043]
MRPFKGSYKRLLIGGELRELQIMNWIRNVEFEDALVIHENADTEVIVLALGWWAIVLPCV